MVILSINIPENSAKLYIDDNLLALNLVKLHIKNSFEIESCEKKPPRACTCGDWS